VLYFKQTIWEVRTLSNSFVGESVHLITGNVYTKKGKVVIVYNKQKKISSFMYEHVDSEGKKTYEVLENKFSDKFNSIFNIVEEDIIYQNSNIESINELENIRCEDDEFYVKLLKEAVRKSLHEIKIFFGECNAENFLKRKHLLSFKISEPDSDGTFLSGFSRWNNVIYIAPGSFYNPKSLLNAVTHELIHVFGTETEITNNGNIKKRLSRKTGFESKMCFGKGINEGFVEKYANTISEYQGNLTFEVRVADLIEIILDDDLAMDNFMADTRKLINLSKDIDEVIVFIKTIDNYHAMHTRYIRKVAKYADVVTNVKHDFITKIERKLIYFFRDSLVTRIKKGIITDIDELYEIINTFKEKLIFKENISEELHIDTNYIQLEEFDELKTLFCKKMKEVIEISEMYIKKDFLDEEKVKFVNKLKRICDLTCKITDIYEIKDDVFKNHLDLNNCKVYFIAKKINKRRIFNVVSINEEDEIEEVKFEERMEMKDLKDSILYDNLFEVGEVREKERRVYKGKIYSIYRTHTGEFGISDIVDKVEKKLKVVKLEKVDVPYEYLDDSIYDFSYLYDYLIPKKMQEKVSMLTNKVVHDSIE